MNRTLIGVVASVALLAAAGCGSGSTGKPTATPAPTTSTSASASVTPTLSPAIWTKEEAAAKYLDMVAPLNAAIVAMGATLTVNDSTWQGLKKHCAGITLESDTFMQRLSDGQWPTDAKPAVDDLITSVATSRSWYLKCSQATSADDIAALGAVNQGNAGAAQVLRLKLGLPGPS